MRNCLTCGKFAPEPGVAYGYSGPVCQCIVAPKIQRLAGESPPPSAPSLGEYEAKVYGFEPESKPPSEWERERDAAAEASVTRYNSRDAWEQYEMRKCGKLSFIEGADFGHARASSNIPRGEAFWRDEYYRLSGEINRLTAELAQKQRAGELSLTVCEEHRATIDKLRAENAELKRELDATTGDAMCARQERDQLTAELSESRRQRDKWLASSQFQQTQAEKLRAKLEIEHMAASVEAKEADKLRAGLQSAGVEIDRYMKERDEARAECERLKAALDFVRAQVAPRLSKAQLEQMDAIAGTTTRDITQAFREALKGEA